MGHIFHLGGRRAGLNVSSGGGRFSLGGRGTSAVVDPYAAHVAALQAIDPSGSYFTAQDYTASLSQAGRFVDAFGGALTYDSPNVMASPTRVVDATSGMVYVSSDGADDTAIGSAAETCAAYTAVFRSPVTPFATYGSIIDEVSAEYNGLCLLLGGDTKAVIQRSLLRDGVVSPTGDLSPITEWMVATIFTGHPTTNHLLALLAYQQGYFARLHLACLRMWSIDPSGNAVSATEAEMMSYYAEQYGIIFL